MGLGANKIGFSLVEVMVAVVIFSIAVVGVYASLASLKEQSNAISDVALGAALCGQAFLEERRAAVDQRDWDTGKLAVTTGAVAAPDCVQNGTTYRLSYVIENDPVGNARKGTVTVTW